MSPTTTDASDTSPSEWGGLRGALLRVPDLVVPELDAADDAFVVGDEVDIPRQPPVEQAGIAAADMQLVEIQQGAQHGDHLQHAAPPLLLADLLQRRIADILVVGQRLVDRMV